MASTEVRREDQERINEFSRLNTRRHEIEAEVSARKVRREFQRRPCESCARLYWWGGWEDARENGEGAV